MNKQTVELIRYDWLTGKYSIAELKKKYGVSNVQQIVQNKQHYDPLYIPPKRKGQGPRGERHRSSKLTESQVREIRQLYKGGTHHNQIAAKFKISRAAVYLIVTGKRWGYI